MPQTLGISVLEPNAAGALVPIGLDSGVEVAAPLVGARARRGLRITAWSSGRGRARRWCS